MSDVPAVDDLEVHHRRARFRGRAPGAGSGVEQVKEAVSDAVKRTTRNYSSNGLECCIHIRYPNNAVSGNLRMIVWSRGLELGDWYR